MKIFLNSTSSSSSSLAVVLMLSFFLIVVISSATKVSAFQSSSTTNLGTTTRQSRQYIIPHHATVSGADIEQDDITPPQVVGNTVMYRGNVNVIDYCIAPADVSLSRAYDQAKKDNSNDNNNNASSSPTSNTLSLTRALNDASNRAVRRIILARCWPSEEALNKSLRLAAAAEKQAQREREASGSTSKCPVPRPILNLLMRRDASSSGGGGGGGGAPAMSKGRTNEQYVEDQIKAFGERYGSLPGYSYAEAYLESVLSLATNGSESPRVSEVIGSGIYDESYKRMLSVLKSIGATLEEIPDTDRCRIAKKLVDKDICLSMLDKIAIKKGDDGIIPSKEKEEERKEEEETVIGAVKSEESNENSEQSSSSSGKKRRLKFWMKEDDAVTKTDDNTISNNPDNNTKKAGGRDDSGLVLLSDEEPTMTRQLNALSNIVQRALLFGGDQELLVLSETLETNKEPFVERWYPETGGPCEILEEETRPGVQYLNSLINLLRRAYDDGVVTDLEPAVSLIQSYSNAYERLMANLVQLGSGYVRSLPSSDISTMPKPRTANEELGRFAVLESQFRAKVGKTGNYPEDLEGTWEVKDEVGGELIGISTVVFEPQGQVNVEPPLLGLRWRLDPGPTHLDTCTFQVLSEDGTVLQYRGFIDRGARLEARFSKRPVAITGSVMFQMRDGDVAGMGDEYWKDILPVNYKTGTTKFEMTKKVN